MRPNAKLPATLCMIFALVAGMSADSARAQFVVGVKAGIVQYVRGDVFLDSTQVKLSKSDYLQMQPGQSLLTELGFVEMLLSPQVYLRMGAYGRLQVEQNLLRDTRLVLERGSVLIEIVQEIKETQTRIRLGDADVEIRKKGLYRFDAGSGEVRVYGGAALVSRANEKATIKGGRMVSLNAGLAVKKFDRKKSDVLHQWSARRSFDLFQTNTGMRIQNHWQRLSLGWAVNANYRIRFFSERLLREWKMQQHVPLDAKIAAEMERERIRAEREYLEQKAIQEKRNLEAARNQGLMPPR